MLRFGLLVLIASAPFLRAAPVPQEKPKEVDPFLGKWKVIEVLVGGRATGKVREDSAVFIEADKMIFTGIPKEPDETMTYKRDAAKKQIDMGVNQGKFQTNGVYTLEGDVLKIAITIEPEKGRPGAAVSGPSVVYLQLERIKVEKK